MTQAEQDPPVDFEQLASELGLDFSVVEGYTPKDFNSLCSITGLPCDAKLRVISQYTRHIEADDFDAEEAERSVNIACLKLNEYDYWAGIRKVLGKTCEVGHSCTVRESMDNSEVRTVTLQAFRKTRRLFRKTKNKLTD